MIFVGCWRPVDGSTTRGTEAAKAAFAWRAIDAELAELVFDSAVDALESDLVMRGGGIDMRQLTFSTDDVTIEIEIGPAGLMGQIIPAQPARVEVFQGAEEPIAVEADEFGVFQVAELRPGPTTLIARPLDDSWSVRTAWLAT